MSTEPLNNVPPQKEQHSSIKIPHHLPTLSSARTYTAENAKWIAIWFGTTIFFSAIAMLVAWYLNGNEQFLGLTDRDMQTMEIFVSVFGLAYAVIVGLLIIEAHGRMHDLSSAFRSELNAISDIHDCLYFFDDDKDADINNNIYEELITYVDRVRTYEMESMKHTREGHLITPSYQRRLENAEEKQRYYEEKIRAKPLYKEEAKVMKRAFKAIIKGRPLKKKKAKVIKSQLEAIIEERTSNKEEAKLIRSELEIINKELEALFEEKPLNEEDAELIKSELKKIFKGKPLKKRKGEWIKREILILHYSLDDKFQLYKRIDPFRIPRIDKILGNVKELKACNEKKQIVWEKILGKVCDLTSWRTNRLELAEGGLKGYLKVFVGFMSAIIIIGTILLELATLELHMFMVFATTAGVVGLFIVLYDVDSPFSGIWQIDENLLKASLDKLKRHT